MQPPDLGAQFTHLLAQQRHFALRLCRNRLCLLELSLGRCQQGRLLLGRAQLLLGCLARGNGSGQRRTQIICLAVLRCRLSFAQSQGQGLKTRQCRLQLLLVCRIARAQRRQLVLRAHLCQSRSLKCQQSRRQLVIQCFLNALRRSQKRQGFLCLFALIVQFQSQR